MFFAPLVRMKFDRDFVPTSFPVTLKSASFMFPLLLFECLFLRMMSLFCLFKKENVKIKNKDY